MGSSTLKAMRDLAVGTHLAVAGARGEFAAGNGAAIRIAALAFLMNPAASQDRTLIRDVCRITHHSDEAYVGALAVLLAIHSVLSGVWSQDRNFLDASVDSLPDSAVRDRIKEVLLLQLPASEIARSFGPTGHVVDTVPLALHCARPSLWSRFRLYWRGRSASAGIPILLPLLSDSLLGPLLVRLASQAEFDSERVLIEDPRTDEALEVRSGTVLWHGKDREEVYRVPSKFVPSGLRSYIRARCLGIRRSRCELRIRTATRLDCHPRGTYMTSCAGFP
jgi:hypothetical protein